MPTPRGVLLALVASAAAATLGIEVLSAFGALRQISLAGLSLVSLSVFVRLLIHDRNPPETTQPDTPPLRFLRGILLAIGGVTLVIALVSAPNTWDSMTYHLARVAQWYDHGSVAHYVTGIDRQLWQPPFGEYLVLLGYGALGGRDHLANLPQWIAGVGTVLATMEIARALGASPRARYVVGLATATAPVIILESTSTHTDLLAAMWLAIVAWLALVQFHSPERGIKPALWIGAALALAIGTKGTALPLGLPWLVLFLSPAFRPFDGRTVLRHAAIAAGTILLFTGWYARRNLAVFDQTLGPEGVQRMLRPASLGPASIASNLAGHLSLQLGTPWPAVNEALTGVVTGFTRMLGQDPAQLYPYFGGFRVIEWSTREDTAGNPVQVLLGMLGLISVAGTWRGRTRGERAAAVTFGCGIVLFVLTVRWQPYIARLHAPVIALLPACLFLPLARQWPRLVDAGLIAGVALAFPALVANASRPLLSITALTGATLHAESILTAPRQAQYFANRPELYEPYRQATIMLHRLGCTRVPVRAGYDSWEYPLWALGRRLGMTFVHGSGPSSEPASSKPCALVALDQPPEWRPRGVRPDASPLVDQGGVRVWRL